LLVGECVNTLLKKKEKEKPNRGLWSGLTSQFPLIASRVLLGVWGSWSARDAAKMRDAFCVTHPGEVPI
jgi:hypothetical protein